MTSLRRSLVSVFREWLHIACCKHIVLYLGVLLPRQIVVGRCHFWWCLTTHFILGLASFPWSRISALNPQQPSAYTGGPVDFAWTSPPGHTHRSKWARCRRGPAVTSNLQLLSLCPEITTSALSSGFCTWQVLTSRSLASLTCVCYVQHSKIL